MIRTLLVDDHQIVRSGIKSLLEDENIVKVIEQADNGKEAVEKVQNQHFDLVIMDIRMPIMNGLEATQIIKEKFPSLKVLILSMHDEEDYIINSLKHGADGYLLKDTNKGEFAKAIQSIMEGTKYFSGDVSNNLINGLISSSPAVQTQKKTSDLHELNLTKRETEILRLIADGLPNKEIAIQLSKSVRTIETHRFNIMKKLKVNNVAELLKRVDGFF